MGIWKNKAPTTEDQLPVDDVLRYLRAGSVIRYESGRLMAYERDITDPAFVHTDAGSSIDIRLHDIESKIDPILTRQVKIETQLYAIQAQLTQLTERLEKC